VPLALSAPPSGTREVGFVELQATPTMPRVTTVKTRIEVLMIFT
jgi:hypothetical protein